MLGIVVALGVVEGLTEFLPVSSTGHLILVGHWLGYRGAAASIFEVVIQLGAILAVVVEYRARLFGMVREPLAPRSRRLLVNVLVGFLPSAILGFFLHDLIKTRLFGPRPVALALIVGALAIFAVERWRRAARTADLDAVDVRQALVVGVAQCAALFPGVSRAAATILGGLGAGLDRPTSAQYSFLLAIPTIAGAAVLDLAKGFDALAGRDLQWIGLGMVVSFLSAWAAVRWFVRYVSHHSLNVFAVYRIVLGLLVLWLLR
jgi:undecaprenyl-diphosphatase